MASMRVLVIATCILATVLASSGNAHAVQASKIKLKPYVDLQQTPGSPDTCASAFRPATGAYVTIVDGGPNEQSCASSGYVLTLRGEFTSMIGLSQLGEEHLLISAKGAKHRPVTATFSGTRGNLEAMRPNSVMSIIFDRTSLTPGTYQFINMRDSPGHWTCSVNFEDVCRWSGDTRRIRYLLQFRWDGVSVRNPRYWQGEPNF